MSHPDLEPSIAPGELRGLIELSGRLTASRPVPSPNFRGELGRAIALRRPEPSWLRLRVAGCLASGIALLLAATLGVNGEGPLAPQPLAPAVPVASSSVSR